MKITHLTPLQIKLLDEYYRYERGLKMQEERISTYCKGSLQKKLKNNHLYYYLVWRENGKVKIKYIKEEDVVKTQVEIEKRTADEYDCTEMRFDMKLIEKALGKVMIDEYRGKI